MRVAEGLELYAPDPGAWGKGVTERPAMMAVGYPGSGKSLLAVNYGLERMRSGQSVMANIGLTDWQRGLMAGRFWAIRDLISMRNQTVIIDEGGVVFDAREWSLIPAQVRTRWKQSRKAGLELIITAQHEDQVDKVLRDQIVTHVALCDRVPMTPRSWLLFRTRWCYMQEVAGVRSGTVQLRPRDIGYWHVSQLVRMAYDTHEIVDESEALRERDYLEALRQGKRPDVSIETPEPIPPRRWDPVTRSWVEWDDGKSLCWPRRRARTFAIGASS